MATKFYVDGTPRIFSVVEETEFFRLTVSEPIIEDYHVEDFVDTTVEWLSSNPSKGILIDFTGVKWICDEFVVHLAKYFADLKARGIYVRFVNVNPEIKPYVDISDITVVLPIPSHDKPSLSARAILRDLADELSDSGLMRKHGLSRKGLESMYRKLLARGLITEDMIERRRGPTASTIMVAAREAGSDRKVVIDAGEAVKDILDNMSDKAVMAKYRLSEKGLRSMLNKLYAKGLISSETLRQRMGAEKE